jgi:hypothetical protein
VCESPISSNIPIKPIPIWHVKIIIPSDTFQKHLPKDVFPTWSKRNGDWWYAYLNQSLKPSHCGMDYH